VMVFSLSVMSFLPFKIEKRVAHATRRGATLEGREINQSLAGEEKADRNGSESWQRCCLRRACVSKPSFSFHDTPLRPFRGGLSDGNRWFQK
jgi:hypothetical protein